MRVSGRQLIDCSTKVARLLSVNEVTFSTPLASAKGRRDGQLCRSTSTRGSYLEALRFPLPLVWNTERGTHVMSGYENGLGFPVIR